MKDPRHARLLIHEPGGSREVALTEENTVGRQPDNTIQILDRCISKRQARIFRRKMAWVLQDLGSLNGTVVDGVRILDECELHDGAAISMGGTARLVFLWENDAEPVSALLPPESGQLMVERSGDIRLRIWNTQVGAGGFLVRIPLGDARPEDLAFDSYRGKSEREILVCSGTGPLFLALAESLRLEMAGRSAGDWPDALCHAVSAALGGEPDRDMVRVCEAECSAYSGREIDIDHFLTIGVGVCRHRAFLLHHLAESLGIPVSTHRGRAIGGRHAWNEIRIGGRRAFVDAMAGLVMGDTRRAERSLGYEASCIMQPAGITDDELSRLVQLDEFRSTATEFRFEYEIRKAPSGKEALLVVYPENDLDAHYLYAHLRLPEDLSAIFGFGPLVSHRVYSVRGDFAHFLMDGLDRQAVEKLHSTLAACRRTVEGIENLVS